MAQLGIRKFDDLIGHAELLDMKKGIEHWKAKGLDFSRVFYQPQVPAEVARKHVERAGSRSRPRARPHADREGEGGHREGRARRRSSSRCATSIARCGAMLSGHDREEVRPRRPARRRHPHPVEGHGRPELRRVPREGRHAGSRRRRQRLRRQGLVGRAHHHPSHERLPRQVRREHHLRQHGDVRRDRRRSLSSAAWRASASACATRARRRLSKARATTAANT